MAVVDDILAERDCGVVRRCRITFVTW